MSGGKKSKKSMWKWQIASYSFTGKIIVTKIVVVYVVLEQLLFKAI